MNIVAKGGGAALSFLLYVVLARAMTPEGFADVALVLAWLAIATSLAGASAPLVLVRHVPESMAQGRADLTRGVIRFSFLSTGAIAAGVSVIAAGAIFSGLVGIKGESAASALFGAALLLPSVLLLDLAGLLTGLKRAAMAELLVNVARPFFTIAALAVFWAFQPPPTTSPTVVATYLGASLVMAMVTLAYTRSVVPLEVRHAPPAYAIGEWLRSATGFMGIAIALAIHERIDLLMMGMIAAPTEVAAYAVAARFAQTVVVAASAVGAVMAPHLVERLADMRQGRRTEAQLLVRTAARHAFLLSLAALAAFALLGPLLLGLLGPHYEQAYVPLLILATGQAIAALAGPATGVAALSGSPRIAIVSLSAGIVVNAAMNAALVPVWGARGAALATATGMVVAAVAAWLWTRRKLHIDASVFARAT